MWQVYALLARDMIEDRRREAAAARRRRARNPMHKPARPALVQRLFQGHHES